MLAAAMLITVFPFSAAADSDQSGGTSKDPDVSVSWDPQETTAEGSATVELSASLKEGSKSMA